MVFRVMKKRSFADNFRESIYIKARKLSETQNIKYLNNVV